MTPDNPACYECPKTKNGLHLWQSHRNISGQLLGANCIKCELFLTRQQALELGYKDIIRDR